MATASDNAQHNQPSPFILPLNNHSCLHEQDSASVPKMIGNKLQENMKRLEVKRLSLLGSFPFYCGVSNRRVTSSCVAMTHYWKK
jgi:hypothetical protein